MSKRAFWSLTFLAAGFSVAFDALGDELIVTSKTSGTHLIELFTSEGCSSCPAAETWLGKLKSDDRLWQEFVPIAFHVDYWDNLRWKDRFARAEWTQRQRVHATRWGNSSVYTPAFVLDGREWQDWTGKLSFPPKENGGLLTARANGNTIKVTFQSTAKFDGGSAHVAWLGFNLLSNVKGGENAGRSLRHDFIVLGHAAAPLMRDPDGGWKTEINSTAMNPEAGALACWIESNGLPVQAAGGWLLGYRKS